MKTWKKFLNRSGTVKNTGRKWMLAVTMLMAVVLICGLLPSTAMASPATKVTVAGVELSATGFYATSNLSGGPASSEPANKKGYVHWDVDNSTLTLYGVTLNDTGTKGGIYASGDFTILLAEGSSNTISSSATNAITCDRGSVTIKGAGSLNATGATNGIRAKFSVNLTEGANVTVKGNNGCGIVNNPTTFSNNADPVRIDATVTATITGSTYGISVEDGYGASPVIDSVNVTITGGTAAFSAFPHGAPKFGKGVDAVAGSSESNLGSYTKDAFSTYKVVKTVLFQPTYLDSTGAAKTCEDCTKISDQTTWNAGWYYAEGKITISKRITVEGDVHLILGDGCTLTASEGITVNDGNSLTIYAQSTGSNMGNIEATGDRNCAGIGGGRYNKGGNITINGGNVTATGGENGAGIGGGYGEGGNITINGGNVTATGGAYGAGIGGGKYYDGGTILIGNATVNATGNNDAQNIGCGSSGDPSYKVTFDANGGGGKMYQIYLKKGEEYTLPECGFITAPGNKPFVVWSIDGVIYEPGDKIKISKDITVTALWEMPHICSEGTEWKSDGNNHWHVCADPNCGAVIESSKAAHTATGANVATCTKLAVCDVCGVSYGTVKAHSYTAQIKNQDTLKTAGDCRDKAVYWYSCAGCGKVENNDSHTFTGDKAAATHVGGTTLVNQAEADHKTQINGYTGDTKCLGCGEILTYGQVIPAGAHTPATTWSTDGENHWRVCTVENCGVIIEGSKAAHTATGNNVATCQKEAVCDICRASYGDVAGHDAENTLSFEATGHWYACKTPGCAEKISFAPHNPDHEGGATEEYAVKCTLCNYVIEPMLGHTHKYGTEWKSDKDSHWNVCTDLDCGAVNESSKAQHTSTGANVATCTKLAVCDVCGASYGDMAAHTPDHEGSATEEYAIKCTLCGYEIQPALEHSHAYDTQWKSDENGHWNECVCGDKANTAAHTDADADGRCDVCRYSVGVPDNGDDEQKPEDTSKNDGDEEKGEDAPKNDGVVWIILIGVGVVVVAGVVIAIVLTKKKSSK